jgi:hypothetical protein
MAKRSLRSKRHRGPIPARVEELTRIDPPPPVPKPFQPEDLDPRRPSSYVENCVNMTFHDCDVGPTQQLLQVGGTFNDIRISNSYDREEFIRERRIQRRTDDHSVSTVVSDADAGTSVIARARGGRSIKAEEETTALQRLAWAWNRLRGTRYVARHQPDTLQFEDGFLAASGSCAPNIPVQVTQLDASLKGDFCRDGFVEHALAELPTAIRAAVHHKRDFDTDMKRKTILLLISPVAIGTAAREQLQAQTFDICGYREAWVSPAGEAAFPLPAAQ